MNVDDLPALCFDGVIPSGLATVSDTGTPHFTWLSQVHRLDATHVAISCQFFRQTKRNLASIGKAQVLIVDPGTGRQWKLDAQWEGSVTSGPLFDRMDQKIKMIASQSERSHGFALQSAEVFEVRRVTPVLVERELVQARPRPVRDELDGLAKLAAALATVDELGAVVETGLSVLAQKLGYERIAIYVYEAAEKALYALGSRGFRASGIGASVPLGTSIVGVCAQNRLPVRVAEVHRELRFQRAVLEQQQRALAGERDIALPGMEGARSMLAVPLILSGAVVGVLATESDMPYAFDERDERVLITAGQLLAQAIETYDIDDDELPSPVIAPAKASGSLRVRYYEADDSVFVDDDYLIKGLPGRILYLMLSLRETERRDSFQNKELRLHPFLKLPSYKDNLEARLLMLQRRLEEKGIALQLDRAQRGKIRVRCALDVALEKVA